jgi:hypothetical protein
MTVALRFDPEPRLARRDTVAQQRREQPGLDEKQQVLGTLCAAGGLAADEPAPTASISRREMLIDPGSFGQVLRVEPVRFLDFHAVRRSSPTGVIGR